MTGIFPLRNETMAYDWGSKSAIPKFLGLPDSPTPAAEVWLGAHPKASSQVQIEGSWVPLHEAVQQNPSFWLGSTTADLFENRLPFLFKILAAAKPLSIQAHPNHSQARAGFEREERTGPERWHEKRNYRDRNHKPEIIYALTPFTALCGFRQADEIHSLLDRFGIAEHWPKEAAASTSQEDLRQFFGDLLSLDKARLQIAMETALRADDDSSELRWMQRMSREFPGDRGVLAPLFLNLLTLEPGQAMFTGPGILHAYLDGLGIELMASSDNVLRGGCTSKHVDPAELLRVISFEPHAPHLVSTDRSQSGVEIFKTPVREFELSRLTIDSSQPFDSRRLQPNPCVQILLCSEGEGELLTHSKAPKMPFNPGESFIVPAALDGFQIRGEGAFFRATPGFEG